MHPKSLQEEGCRVPKTAGLWVEEGAGSAPTALHVPMSSARIRPSSPSTAPGQDDCPQQVLVFHPAHIHSYSDNSEPPPAPFPLTTPPHSKPLSF